MKLFIAEKPSMARELAKCLPQPQRQEKGFIRTGGGIVTWAYGHMLQQAEPQDYNRQYKQWKDADLPIIPAQWKLLVSPNSREQFDVICRLISDADTIVHAGDPDREGQLLIDEILDYVGNTKRVERILLNALDEKSIGEALRDLRDNGDFFHLKESALARSRADWLIGMNLSRAYTLAARRQGHRVVFPIGRVKTPTLALVVRRQREIDNFKPVTYYVVKAKFDHAKGVITAQWQPGDTQAGLDSEGRCVDRRKAEEILERLRAQPDGTIAEGKKTKKKEAQRLPLSLSSLQVLAGKRYGYSPQQVLDAAQQLYERKLTTYPRSDCEYLPLNQRKDVPAILANLGRLSDKNLSQWAGRADGSIKSRAWNDGKITAHHAIIPTTVPCPYDKLTAVQKNIYFLIAQAYMAQFYPVHEYIQNRIVVAAAGEQFVAHGKTVVVLGWKELYQSDADDEDEKGELPPVRKGDGVQFRSGKVEEKATKAPPRFTSSTLLQAMKEIYKYVKDDSLKKKLKEVQGIGTEATRATIIGELIERKFLAEEGKKKYLKPTDMAYLLVDSLPDELLYPDETAVWEERLYQMSLGKDSLADFLGAQELFLRKLIDAVQHGGGMPQPKDGRVCPQCGGAMVRRHGKYGDFWGCTNYPKCRHTERIDAPPASAAGGDSPYICPRCKEGTFVRRSGPYGSFWACSKEGCRTTCADVNGVPSIYAASSGR